MDEVLKISKFVKYFPYKSRVLLFNGMFGGFVVLSTEEFYLLENRPERLSRLRTSQLLKSNIFIGDAVDESELLTNLQEQSLDGAVSCNYLQCLELSVSEQCNYRCTYCTFWRNRNCSSGKGLMSEELAMRAFADFARLTENTENPVLYFGTGEPLLNWKVIAAVSRRAHKLRPDIQLSLITNGSLMTEEKLRFCQQYGISVGLSIDGRAETQRRQRVPISKRIDSSQVILDLIETGKKIGVKFSCLSGTYRDRDFLEDVQYLNGLCVKYGIPELDIDYDTGGLNESTDPDSIVKELIEGYSLARKAGLNVFGYWMIPFLNILDTRRCLKHFCGNTAGRSVCIASNGCFKQCGYEPRGISVYTSISDHLSAEPFRELCRRHLPGNNRYCIGCCLEGVCAGQCMLSDPGSPNWTLTCDFYKKSTLGLLVDTQ